MTTYNVQDILKELKSIQTKENANKIGAQQETVFLEDELANQISSETHFDAVRKQLYFFIREANSESKTNEGFAEKVELQSELHDG